VTGRGVGLLIGFEDVGMLREEGGGVDVGGEGEAREHGLREEGDPHLLEEGVPGQHRPLRRTPEAGVSSSLRFISLMSLLTGRAEVESPMASARYRAASASTSMSTVRKRRMAAPRRQATTKADLSLRRAMRPLCSSKL